MRWCGSRFVVAWLGAALLLAGGCDSGAVADPCSDGDAPCYFYEADSDIASPAVQGYLVVRLLEPDSDGVQLATGTWQLERMGEGEVGPQVGSGLLIGAVRGERVSLTLNPDTEAAVELVGVFGTQGFSGQWEWTPADAPLRTGPFRATRVAPDAAPRTSHQYFWR